MTLTLRVALVLMSPTKFPDPGCVSGHAQLNTETNSYFSHALSTVVGEWGARVVKNKTPVIFSQ